MTPFDGAIAAARTCYSPRVIATAEVTDRQRDTIGALTFDAGHHTVYQHAHFEFGLENVSRHFVWTFLHSYPFYNSEQSSQRYVKLKEPRAFVPPLDGEARDIYERIFTNYCKKLGMNRCPDAVEFLYERYYNRGRCPRASDCRDLLETVQSICRFRRIPVQLTRALMSDAAASFIREFN